MGEEWAASTPFLYFTDHQEPDVAEAVRDAVAAAVEFVLEGLHLLQVYVEVAGAPELLGVGKPVVTAGRRVGSP